MRLDSQEYAVDRISGILLYMRHCHRKGMDMALVDTGYYSEGNVDALYADKIGFVSKMCADRKLFRGSCRKAGQAYDAIRKPGRLYEKIPCGSSQP